jgi:hypothetical protein
MLSVMLFGRPTQTFARSCHDHPSPPSHPPLPQPTTTHNHAHRRPRTLAKTHLQSPSNASALPLKVLPLPSSSSPPSPAVARTDVLALERAAKHEAQPSTLKMSKYAETLDLKSASAWDKFSLVRFGVEFDVGDNTDLETLIDARWYDPETETCRKNFPTCSTLLTQC